MRVFHITAVLIAVIIMILSIFNFMKIKSFIEQTLNDSREKVKKIGLGYVSLLYFFTFAYLAYLIKFCKKEKYDTELLITILLFGGSIFVFITIGILKRLINGIWEAKLNQTDALTGLMNKEGMRVAFSGELRKKSEKCALILVDLDNFKQVNDKYGHNAGDDILRSVSQIIRNQIKAEDMAGRFGGDEFTILLRNVTAEEATETATNIKRQVEEYCREVCVDANAGASIGIAYKCMQEEGDYEKLFERADRAMYYSKLRGKNRVTLESAVSFSSMP